MVNPHGMHDFMAGSQKHSLQRQNTIFAIVPYTDTSDPVSRGPAVHLWNYRLNLRVADLQICQAKDTKCALVYKYLLDRLHDGKDVYDIWISFDFL